MNKKTNPPSHLVYAVTKGKDNRRYWQKIGATFPHADGDGFNLALDYLPLNGADIVIRKPKAEEPEAPVEAPADAA